MEIARVPSHHEHYKKEEYLFSEHGRMVAYVNVHYPHRVKEVAYIIDTVSARAYSLLSPKIQELFTRNGFMPHDGDSLNLRGKGMHALEMVLSDIYRRKGEIHLAVICTKESSREYFERSLFRYFSPIPTFARRITGGGDGAVATFIFDR